MRLPALLLFISFLVHHGHGGDVPEEDIYEQVLPINPPHRAVPRPIHAPANEGALTLHEQFPQLIRRIWIVGAGPVGLFLGVLLADKFPDCGIRFFEKRDKDVREQQVEIKDHPPWPSYLQQRKEEFDRSPAWSIKDLQALYKRALTEVPGYYHGKHKTYVWKVDGIEAQMDDAKFMPDVVVFADGARSTARTDYFGGLSHDHLERTAMVIRYRVHSRDYEDMLLKHSSQRRLSRSVKSSLNILSGVFGLESVKESDTITITLLFKANEDHEEVKRFPTMAPALLQPIKDMVKPNWFAAFGLEKAPTESLQDAGLREKILIWINARRAEFGEAVHGPVLVSFYQLRTYRAANVVSTVQCRKTRHKAPAFLVGDAAMSFPYRRGARSGLNNAYGLANALANGVAAQSWRVTAQEYTASSNEQFRLYSDKVSRTSAALNFKEAATELMKSLPLNIMNSRGDFKQLLRVTDVYDHSIYQAQQKMGRGRWSLNKALSKMFSPSPSHVSSPKGPNPQPWDDWPDPLAQQYVRPPGSTGASTSGSSPSGSRGSSPSGHNSPQLENQMKNTWQQQRPQRRRSLERRWNMRRRGAKRRHAQRAYK